ncbi:MAG TPA: glycoside hydrolase family 2 TIM barrel-domain containing protein [Roseiflexaceae bacterium]|nr:glycoside hydrolase family 2 TIM barrel-domain containing protein [Roseiflexaceae bacterium]
MTITYSLNGTWQLLPVDVFRQGFYPLDDDRWVEQSIPAHWQQHPLFEQYAGKMVYRLRFPLPADTGRPPEARYWLRLNGVFYWSQTYFNGVDLGRHEGYFVPQEHDVTGWVQEQNTLLVEVECPDEHDKFGKRLITGVFSHWDCIDPLTNPGGIWLPVDLCVSGPTHIQRVLLHTERFDEASADLRYRACLDAAEGGDVLLRWTFTPKNFAGEVQTIEERRTIAKGQHEIAGQLSLRDPQPWWTHDLGHPNCYTVTLAVVEGGQVSDEHPFTFGIRLFELRNWIAYLNGVRLFIKGNNYAPGDTRIARMTADEFARDLRLARECNMNMLRVHAHVDHPLFYEAADEAGVLLWQDFPLQWVYRRSILPEATRQAREMVRLLYNHPSLAIWCMHNEAFQNADTSDERWVTFIRTYLSVFIWNWNRSVMDRQLKRTAERTDPTRPVVRSSGEFAVPVMRPGTDTHFYHGWYLIYGELHSWDTIARLFPDNIRFITEFGAQSFPNLESCLKFMDPDINQIDWHRLVERHMFQSGIMSHWYDWRKVETLEDLVRMSQDYQCRINRFYIDRLRYHKYRPTGGIVPFMFHDPNPGVLWSILDYWRVPKRSYYEMRDAFSPQYVFTLLDRPSHGLNEAVDLPIYLVNDAQQAVPVSLEARLLAPDGRELAHFERELTLPPDCMAFEAERLRLTPDQPGIYHLELGLRDGGSLAICYTYEVTVRATAS